MEAILSNEIDKMGEKYRFEQCHKFLICAKITSI